MKAILINEKTMILKKIEDNKNLFTSIRNNFLYFVPVSVATTVSGFFYGKFAEHPLVKRFLSDVRDQLVFVGGSPEFVEAVLKEYLDIMLKSTMSAGELLSFSEQLKHYLSLAYDPKLAEGEAAVYKSAAFGLIVSKLGPHLLKYVQSLNAKPNSWVIGVITDTQSNLPVISVREIEEMLIKSFASRGTLEYVDHFSDHFTEIRPVGAGTAGIAAFLIFKETPESEGKPLIVKVIRPNTIKNFNKDHEYLAKAVERLLAQVKITKKAAKSFLELSRENLARELEETNLNIENIHLNKELYEFEKDGSIYVTTIKPHFDLFSKSDNLVFMEVAKGIPLEKYLQGIIRKLNSPVTPEPKKEACLQKLSNLRQRYALLMKLHFGRMMSNQSVHADLHPGNLFYDEESGILSVLDLGAVTKPIDTDKFNMLQQFLFSLNLSVWTADASYLDLFYSNNEFFQKIHGEVDSIVIECLITQVQARLDEIKEESKSQYTVSTDQIMANILEIIGGIALQEDKNVLPDALIPLLRSSALMSNLLRSLDSYLAGTGYENEVPLFERTQTGIALCAALEKSKTNSVTYWTEETWAHFYKNCLSNLDYMNKCMHGIFDLSEQEAKLVDLAIPATCISGPVAIWLGSKFVVKKVNELSIVIPHFMDFYAILKKYHPLEGGSQYIQNIQSMFEKAYARHLNNIKEFKIKSYSPRSPALNFHYKPWSTGTRSFALLEKPLPAGARSLATFTGGVVLGAYLASQKTRDPKDANWIQGWRGPRR